MTDYYATLGLAKGASDAEIKAAFRKLAMEHHPDRNGGSEEASARFKEINEAHSVLSDADKRATYDRFGHAGMNGQQQHHRPRHDFSGGHAHVDAFEAMRRWAEHQATMNRDYAMNCHVSLRDAFTGCVVDVKFEDAQGPRELKVPIPVGADSGMRIRIRGEGQKSNPQSPPGDLVLGIVVEDDETFRRNGPNLLIDVEVSALDAMTGGTVRVPTIEGGELDLKIDVGTPNNWKYRVAGKGMPIMNTNNRGDMIVNIHITIPTDLTDKQIELLNEIKSLSKP